MDQREIRKAKTLLQDHADRFETTLTEAGRLETWSSVLTEAGRLKTYQNWSLTAHWLDGGQRIFWSLFDVQRFADEYRCIVTRNATIEAMCRKS